MATVGFIRGTCASFKATPKKPGKWLLHVVDASSPAAKSTSCRQASSQELAAATRTLLLNNADRLGDRPILDVAETARRARRCRAPQARADPSCAGSDSARQDFADAEITRRDGRVLSYLAAHAEIYRQTYQDDQVILRCYLPRHLLHHIEGPDVEVRFLGNGQGTSPEVTQRS